MFGELDAANDIQGGLSGLEIKTKIIAEKTYFGQTKPPGTLQNSGTVQNLNRQPNGPRGL